MKTFLNNLSGPSKRLSYSDVYSDDSQEELPVKVKVNDYVISKIAGKKSIHNYVGVVTKKFNDELLVKFMKKSANKFVFPLTDDISLIELPDIVTVLDQPTVNNRQQYQFVIAEKFMKLLE